MFLSIAVLILAPIVSSAIKINGQFQPMSDHSSLDGNQWYTKIVNKRNTGPIDRQGYGNDEAPKEVDLHKGEFCVDVSTYGPVKYDKKPVKVCDSTFVKNCKDRSEQVSKSNKKIATIQIILYLTFSNLSIQYFNETSLRFAMMLPKWFATSFHTQNVRC